MGPHVFGDQRVGLWIVNLPALRDRLPRIRTSYSGIITDLFLDRRATAGDLTDVRRTGLHAHLWAAVDGLPADQYAARALEDIDRCKPGACELNVELPNDPALEPYMRAAVGAIRSRRPNLRIRLNVAPFKGGFLPIDLLVSDPNLYVAEQTYYGDMSRVSEAEAMLNLLEAGVPAAKASLCYGAAGPVWGKTGAERVNTIPTLFYAGRIVRTLRRGTIFHDDLMVEVGLL